jgi:hypothetical protein
MTNENVLVDPKTGQEYINVPPRIAAKYLGVSKDYVYSGLKQGVLPFGTAVQSDKGIWSFNIPAERLKIYKNGMDISMLNQLINLVN